MKDFLAVTKALSDENRARIMMFLQDGELCVCQVIAMLELAPSTVSKHLNVLCQAGLIESRKQGRWIYYRLAGPDARRPIPAAIKWLRESLSREPEVTRDAKKRKAVCRTSLSELCCRYAKETK